MQLIPFKVSPEHFNLFVILEDVNLDRIFKYDPAHVIMPNLPEEWQALKLDHVIIGYGTASDIKAARDLIAKDLPFEALQFLSRGFAFKPDEGDHDEPYESMRKR